VSQKKHGDDTTNPLDWATLDSTYLFRERHLTVRSDRCRMPDGRVVDPYYVLEFPAWASVVALTPDRRIVLIREYRHGLGRTLLGLPCGIVEAGETPEMAARRELLEETGYTAGSLDRLCALTPNPATHNNLTYCYLATDAVLTGEQQLDRTEEIEVVTAPLVDMPDLIDRGEFFQALHISAVYFALRKQGLLTAGRS